MGESCSPLADVGTAVQSPQFVFVSGSLCKAADYAGFYLFVRDLENVEAPERIAIIRNIDAIVKVCKLQVPMKQIPRIRLRNARFDPTTLISLE